VNDPSHLALAQEIFASSAGLVPGLQAVWSSDDGLWPWDPASPFDRIQQRLFGRPEHR
jgi:hypothetical protein